MRKGILLFCSFIVIFGILIQIFGYLNTDENFNKDKDSTLKFKTQLSLQYIDIDSNSDFLAYKRDYDWQGNGTKENPIIIENYFKISYIHISNTNISILIRNCSTELSLSHVNSLCFNSLCFNSNILL